MSESIPDDDGAMKCPQCGDRWIYGYCGGHWEFVINGKLGYLEGISETHRSEWLRLLTNRRKCSKCEHEWTDNEELDW